MGYHRAGFRHVLGVDVAAQSRYPFEFHQRDALEVLDCLITGGQLAGCRLADFDAIHASPPCQDHSETKDLGGGSHGTGWMLMAARDLLDRTGLPWALENRSEEHTSELQSLRHLRCRLLPGKKTTTTAPLRSFLRVTGRRGLLRPPRPR